MANTWISVTENDIEEHQIHMKTSKNVIHLGISYIILKISRKNREKKQELFGLGKGKKKTRKE